MAFHQEIHEPFDIARLALRTILPGNDPTDLDMIQFELTVGNETKLARPTP
jgi:hypothetical protein